MLRHGDPTLRDERSTLAGWQSGSQTSHSALGPRQVRAVSQFGHEPPTLQTRAHATRHQCTTIHPLEPAPSDPHTVRRPTTSFLLFRRLTLNSPSLVLHTPLGDRHHTSVPLPTLSDCRQNLGGSRNSTRRADRPDCGARQLDRPRTRAPSTIRYLDDTMG